jgi:hypothetical protein
MLSGHAEIGSAREVVARAGAPGDRAVAGAGRAM